MRPGQASRTAELVCMARALAHDRTAVPRFADPTALSLLPDDARRRVEQMRAGERPASLREGFERKLLERRRDMMVVRTVAIDDAVRAAAAPQVVILGAGLDGRAWRMGELAGVDVFEVDHPDSQRIKRERAAAHAPTARAVHFVPVDFAHGDLDRALADAGHDAARPTTWIWEGVVMYLSEAAIDATLAVVGRRSAEGSHLIVLYMTSAPITPLVGLVVRRLGEPLRTLLSADRMRAVLAAHGFAAVRDDDLPTLGATLSPAAARSTRVMKHLRLVIAVRRR